MLQKFLTDMVAASKRIDTIDEMVSDFVKEKNTQIDKVSHSEDSKLLVLSKREMNVVYT